MTVAASFGLASALSVVVLGDESGYTAGQNQKMKIAAIEAMWDTEPAPASFTLFGLPDLASHTTRYEIKVPWVLGLIATRSSDTPVPGINQLVAHARSRDRGRSDRLSRAGRRSSSDPHDPALRTTLDAHVANLGYALLLKRIRPDIENATPDEIAARRRQHHPQRAGAVLVVPLDGGVGLLVHRVVRGRLLVLRQAQLDRHRWFLWAAALTLPLPWIAAELGWIVAEYGRQPWVIVGVLPTALGVSSTAPGNVLFSLSALSLFYSTLLVADLYLLLEIHPSGSTDAAHAQKAADA